MITQAPVARPFTASVAPLDAATRRRFLGVLTGAGLLAACGTEDDPEPTGIAASTGYPRTVTTARGDVVISAAPRRVVAKYFSSDFDAVYVLGVVPVAVMSGFTQPFPWHDQGVRNIRTLAPATLDSVDWDIEAVAAQRPDLIVCQDGEYDKAAEQLKRLAPCLVLDANKDPDWRADTRMAGKAFAREADADAAITRTEAVIAEAKARLSGLVGRTVRILEVSDPVFYLRSSASLLGKLVIELGLTVPDAKDYTELGEERLGDVSGTDLLLVESYDDALTDKAVQGPVFKLITQVTSGAWARLDATTAAGASTSALSIRYAAPLLADALLSAAGTGDGRRF